jgi:hypothetical protein
MKFQDRNRQNAQSSTGPQTPQGKAASSMNAVKTGLTGRTVLLPSDDVAAFESHIKAYWDEYRPQGLRESELVQSLAETRWRLDRIVSLESAIFAQTAAAPAEGELPLSELDVYLKYEKHLRNLHLQENRLNRRYAQELAELRQLQIERRQAENEASLPSRAPSFEHQSNQALKSPATNSGFVFSSRSGASDSLPSAPLPSAA